jgi:hypothetical protein
MTEKVTDLWSLVSAGSPSCSRERLAIHGELDFELAHVSLGNTPVRLVDKATRFVACTTKGNCSCAGERIRRWLTGAVPE